MVTFPQQPWVQKGKTNQEFPIFWPVFWSVLEYYSEEKQGSRQNLCLNSKIPKIGLHGNQLCNQIKMAVSQLPIKIELWYLIHMKGLSKHFMHPIIWLSGKHFLGN